MSSAYGLKRDNVVEICSLGGCKDFVCDWQELVFIV